MFSQETSDIKYTDSITISKVVDIIVSFTEEQNIIINKNIETFVNRMTEKDQSASYYQEKRNALKDKISDDIFIGKKAEFLALYGMHKIYGFPLINIDMAVRVGHNKKWENDLPFNNKNAKLPNVHVKSCSRKTYNYCNDYSWTFQYNNNNGTFGRDDIFNSSSADLVVLVFMETAQECSGIIKAILPWIAIEKYLKNPKKSTLIGLKKCLYYNDLILNKSDIEKLNNYNLDDPANVK